MESRPLSISASCWIIILIRCTHAAEIRREYLHRLESEIPTRKNSGPRCSRPPARGGPTRRCEPSWSALCGGFRFCPWRQDDRNPQHLDCADRRGPAAADKLLCTIEEGSIMSGITMHSVVALN